MATKQIKSVISRLTKKGQVQEIENEVYLSCTELANYLGVSQPTLWRLKRLGQLPLPAIVRNARWIRWAKADIDVWLKQQTEKGGAK